MSEKEVTENKIVREFVADNFFSGDPEKKDTKVLYVRHGTAPKLLDELKPNKVRHEGLIVAPKAFFEKRKSLHDKNKCHVIVDRHEGTILLVVDENFDEVNTHVLGTVMRNPELDPFQINQGSAGLFEIKELMQTLKFNRIHFANKDENMKIVTNLQNFKAKAEQSYAAIDDQRGNTERSVITKLESDLAEAFVLEMPIYKSGEKKKFKVDILCQATSGGVRVYLESRELHELEVTAKNELLDEQLKAFEEIVVIEQ